MGPRPFGTLQSHPRTARTYLLFLALMGCSDPTAPGDCAGPYTIQVGSGPRPTIRWSPRCPVSDVEVLALEPGVGTLWRITRPDLANRLTSPAAYGKRVPETFMIGPRTDMGPNNAYVIRIGRTDSAGQIQTVGTINVFR
jgi:hypothetical protein